MAVSKRTRFNVFKRDCFKCQYCGRTPPDVILELDHVVPVASGGTDEPVNLTTSCHDCNSGKSDKHLTEIPASIDAGMVQEMERRTQTAALNKWLMKCRKEDDAAITRIRHYWGDVMCSQPGRYLLSDHLIPNIRTFLKSLPEAEIIDAIDILAAKRDRIRGTEFKYFCGICWRKIKGDGQHG